MKLFYIWTDNGQDGLRLDGQDNNMYYNNNK